MKRIVVMIMGMFLCYGTSQAQSQEVQQLILNVEKLSQLKQVLSDMKRGYQVVSSGYGSINDISQGNFSLHQAFMDGLMQVSPAVRRYRKVADIVNYQLILVREYKRAYEGFRQVNVFRPSELQYLGGVYNNLLKRSLNNMEELTNVVTAGKLRMSDDERIRAIDRLYLDMRDKLQFLRSFNNSTSVLASQRRHEQVQGGQLKTIYGIRD
ncbi:TerB family tellurite resistance protein [Pedobacter sp. UBA4863]|uniref:TerB family tellurite resistance protein n=1 Tax=Pedobacter sp. UBA4863 TaxID=1947060 RepID=UPI0025E61EFE|nr:TerB family tellurite resistance protein [Pedobacter sp. UBA4863]